MTSEVPPYDTDGDGLIEITTLAQLNAVRYDPDGDGDPTGFGLDGNGNLIEIGKITYTAAFPDDAPAVPLWVQGLRVVRRPGLSG